MTRHLSVFAIVPIVAAALVACRFANADDDVPAVAPAIALPATASAVATPTNQSVVYLPRHAAGQDLVSLLGQHFDAESGIRLAADPNSNLLVIRAPSASAMDDTLKMLREIDRPARQITFRFFVVEFAAHRDAAKADAAPLDVNTAELTGSAEAVLERLHAWGRAGQIASIKKYSLTVLENKIGELALSETIPMTNGVNLNGPGRGVAPVTVMRDVGTTIMLRPRISQSGEIVSEMSFTESRISPPSRGIELARDGFNAPIIAQGIVNTRLQSTLAIQDGRSSIIAESNADAARMLVVVAAQIVDPNAAAKVSTTISRTTSVPNGNAWIRDRTNLAAALRDARLQERLKLTEQQQQQIVDLRRESAEKLRKLFSESSSRQTPQALSAEFDQKCLELLTAEQKQAWEEWKEEYKRVQERQPSPLRREFQPRNFGERSPAEQPSNQPE